MTNLQAFNIANLCGVAVLSSQLPFSITRKLNKNSKVAAEISKEVQELQQLAFEKKLTPEELKEQIKTFENEDFKGDFVSIDLSGFAVMPEAIKYPDSITTEERQMQLTSILNFLDDYNLIIE